MQQKYRLLLIISVLVLTALTTGVSAEENNSILFILGTDFNEVALNNATSNTNISEQLNITILNNAAETVPAGFNFSNYSVIFIESQPESMVNDWQANLSSNLTTAKDSGSQVIGYNLSSNITVANVDLYSSEYTDIERYWIQGSDANMESMLKLMGQKFCGKWVGSDIPAPMIVHPKVNITFIINKDQNRYHLNRVIGERSVISDRFNVTVMSGLDAVDLTNVSDQDVIMVYMMGATNFGLIEGVLDNASKTGTQIGIFGMSDTNITAIDMKNPPHSAMINYNSNGGYTNMENWIRCIGATLEEAYIEYSPAMPPSVPDHGIYHPDAFPRIFENSTEYLEWYMNKSFGYRYDESAPTIGIIGYYRLSGDTKHYSIDDAIISELEARGWNDTVDYATNDAIIRELESKGCNVIYTTYKICGKDVDHFTRNDTVLVDTIISLKSFNLVYNNPKKSVECLKKYNVPVLKAVTDPYTTPADFINSSRGLNPASIAFQVTYPEIDGCIDYILVGGKVIIPDPNDPNIEFEFTVPIMEQVDWLCDRAISWAELGRANNADKKISIIYYNHEGGKNNIGASYLDIGSSFTLLLDSMNKTDYDIGNGTIPNGSEFIDLFIESRNVGAWAPGELEKVVNSGNVTLVSVNEYLSWYNTLPDSVKADVEATWGEAPGNIMVYEDNFVIPTVQFGNVNFIPQPTRGSLSDESLIYHDKSLPPTHQYLATYFWINKIYDADAMIHFGTHGTQEWLPGKEVGLWRYDYPSIMVDDTPVVYPYIMDNVGEGTQAKRRGNAVIIDHLIPPIAESGLYDELATMHTKIHMYEDAVDPAKIAFYRNSTIQLYENLTMENDLGKTPDELRAMNDTEFGDFASNTLHDYLHKLQGTLMPLGIHTFGVAPQDEKLVCMVKSMLRSDFIDHITNLFPYVSGHEEDWENATEQRANDLLNATLLNGMNVSAAQIEVLNRTDANITADLNMALNYSTLLGQTTREIDQVLHALNAGYIEPGPGNDPIRNPEALPTGRNFYSFDQRKFPDAETEALGVILATQMLEQYNTTHGYYPNKVAYVLWSVETMRHHGLMEAQIYSLLGVKPTRSGGRITGFEVITRENMTHPRIDVLITPSGLYRDTFPYQLELIDKAVRTVAELNESDNFVRLNSLKMEEALKASGYDNTTAEFISRSRIFTEAPGAYGTGLPGAVTASETWDNEDDLADLYISRMSNIYGQDIWGDNYEDVFRLNLMDVDAAVHSDTSNLYGLIDNDDFYQYLGGLGLAVRSLTGDNPEMYVADLKNLDNLQMITLKEAFRIELRARYFNPKWISGMMEYDYAGAREFMKFTEYMWGWDVTTPDLVTDSDWNEIYNIYVNDKYDDLGLDEFFKDNPYQYQSITARMLETTRKLDAEGNPYWDASEDIIQNLVKEYVESVVKDGVTCCHHTCGNPLLDEYIQGMMSVAGISAADQEAYEKLMQEATQRETSSDSTQSERYSSGSSTGTAKIIESGSGNQTIESDAGYGTSADQAQETSMKSTPDDYVEGYEMTKDATSDNAASQPSFSGSDVVGAVLVLLSVGAIFVGFRRRGI